MSQVWLPEERWQLAAIASFKKGGFGLPARESSSWEWRTSAISNSEKKLRSHIENVRHSGDKTCATLSTSLPINMQTAVRE